MDSGSIVRCEWARGSEEMLAYHDREWGVPQHDDGQLFELLVLEGAQAGLSWATVLRKRAAYRAAFDGFDPERVAYFGQADIERLMSNSGIIRNRRKIESTIDNARALLKVREEFSSFDRYIWSFVGGSSIAHGYTRMSDVPAETEESRAMSRDMRRRGFRFVGPTICYAFMQAAGLVNDHTTACYRYPQV